MAHCKRDSPLRDKTTLRWSRLEDETATCIVVSERMELFLDVELWPLTALVDPDLL